MRRSVQETLGRPTVITPETVRKVVVARESGLSIRKACQATGISHEAYYYHIRNKRHFSDILELSENTVKERARLGVIDAIIRGDLPTIRWYLERKDPDFSKNKEKNEK